MAEHKIGNSDMEQNLLNNPDLKKHIAKSMTDKEGFITALDDKVREYGLLNDIKQTEAFLLNTPNFIEEPTALSLLKWSTCITEDVALFENVSKQCLYIMYLLDLCQQFHIEPSECVTAFFTKINQPESQDMFQKEVESFRKRLQTSSWEEVIDDVLKEYSSNDSATSSSLSSVEDEEDGPLDPRQVYTNLPPVLKKCFDNLDMASLEQELNKLPSENAEAYMKKFLRAGLFLPLNEDNGTNSSSNSVSGESNSSSDVSEESD